MASTLRNHTMDYCAFGDVMTEDRGAALQQALDSQDEQGVVALAGGSGAEFYRTNLADRAVMEFPFGVLSREKAIETMAAARPWTRFRIEAPRDVALTGENALLTYRATAQRAGQEPYAALMTTVFVRQECSWKTAFHRQTPVNA